MLKEEKKERKSVASALNVAIKYSKLSLEFATKEEKEDIHLAIQCLEDARKNWRIDNNPDKHVRGKTPYNTAFICHLMSGRSETRVGVFTSSYVMLKQFKKQNIADISSFSEDEEVNNLNVLGSDSDFIEIQKVKINELSDI
jgi:hypothetical protein